MIPKTVITFLKKQSIPFEEIAHKTVYTAYDAAQTLKVKLGSIVKSLVIKADKEYYLVSVPADKNVDFKKVAAAIKKAGGTARNVSLPNEKEILQKLGIKPGKLTGFSSLHKVRSIVDRDIARAKEIIVSGGSVTDSIKIKAKDFLRMGEALRAAVSAPKKLPKLKKVSKPKKQKRPARARAKKR